MEKGKKVLGLDLGSNSVGWAIIREREGNACEVVNLGSRIFNKAVEDKTPTPKNAHRRTMRLARRVIQRRSRRKQRMLNYLVSLKLLPQELQGSHQPEIVLNELGDPYYLRYQALERRLKPYELGRILLQFSNRRGFLSNRKQAAGDLIDDPDTIEYLRELDNQKSSTNSKEENQFKQEIQQLSQEIQQSGARTLGEYLFFLESGKCKRNRSHAGGYLRTDRAMYQYELNTIWQKQQPFFEHLPADFMVDKKGVWEIIFYQRPLKLKKDRVGKCSLEPKNTRAQMGKLEVQIFRYLQDINNLTYTDQDTGEIHSLDKNQQAALVEHCEHNAKITPRAIRKLLKLEKKTAFNLEGKNIKGNSTACAIPLLIGEAWDANNQSQQKALVEDLITIQKKSVLKKRLIEHWRFSSHDAVQLSLLELEPGHSSHSLKAINKLLPYLKQGQRYDQARKEAGYGYQQEEIEPHSTLGAPPETSNPIVNRGLHELKRVVNACIQHYGKPDAIRIEMARDLEMNTTRYQEHTKQQAANEKRNKEAEKYFAQVRTGWPSRDDKIKYRLWQDQKEHCAYSNRAIALNQLFSNEVEIDHILPYSQSLDNSYMNKALCLTVENRNKSNKTPKDAWQHNTDKWHQITQAISRWDSSLHQKKARFFCTAEDLKKKDFTSSQLNDTRYFSKLAQSYLAQLGCDISVTKGIVVSTIRHQWGLNSLLGATNEKERTDHRHHAVDAVVIAATSRTMYQKAVDQMTRNDNKLSIDLPYADILQETRKKLDEMIVSHSPQRKINGALHEETGANYIEKHGGMVYRKTLNSDFTAKNLSSIVDPDVQEIVKKHLSKHASIKEAFADGNTVYHKDGTTPIYRVRVLQSQTNAQKIADGKFAIHNAAGKVFKYMSFGNTHHVTIFQHPETGKVQTEFVTMMEAAHRVRGIGKPKQAIVNKKYGDGYTFIMALHVNDMVSTTTDSGDQCFYRVQKINKNGNTITLRWHRASTLNNKEEEITLSINAVNLEKHKLRFHLVNVIGQIVQ